MTKILLFAGSLRRDSYQGRLVRYMAERLGIQVDVDILAPAEIDLPIFNQDLEDEPAIRAQVWKIYERFAAADGVIIASPEYNAQVSPFLKNTFDWVSRLPRIAPPTPSAFRGKHLLLSCATTGWTGGIQGLLAARLLFSYMGFIVVPEQIAVSHVNQWQVDESFVFEANFSAHIDRVLHEFAAITIRHALPINSTVFKGDLK